MHLLTGGELTSTTRDHNAVDDDSDGEYRDHFAGRRDLLQQVTTRVLPPTGRRRPERAVWSFSPPGAVVVCSSAVHRYRTPSEYAATLLDPSTEIADLGFAASVALE